MKYKRLTEYQYQCNECEKRICKYNQPCAEENICKVYNRLAELEDKIEQGTLIELPCKVGDRIWVILGNNIFGRKVKSIVIRNDGYTIKTSNTNGWKDLEPYYNAELGIIWFLTKAEAEQKLKELGK